jgi:hypothetical protein
MKLKMLVEFNCKFAEALGALSKRAIVTGMVFNLDIIGRLSLDLCLIETGHFLLLYSLEEELDLLLKILIFIAILAIR